MARSSPRRAPSPEDLVYFDSTALTGDRRPVDPDEDAAVYQALVLGTRDYSAQVRASPRYWYALSGGVDSALVAAIAVDALGKENVTTVGNGPASTLRRLHRTMPARSQTTSAFATTPSPSMTSLTSTSRLWPRASRGPEAGHYRRKHPIRIRGNLLMALSNKFNALVLTTGNKSECRWVTAPSTETWWAPRQ